MEQEKIELLNKSMEIIRSYEDDNFKATIIDSLIQDDSNKTVSQEELNELTHLQSEDVKVLFKKKRNNNRKDK